MTVAANPKRNLRKRACAAADCRTRFKPRIYTQTYCSKLCRDRCASRRRYARKTQRAAQ